MKRWLVPVAIVVAVLGALAIVVEGRSSLGDARDFVLRGKPMEAIGAYEDAARWYLPLAPHVDTAYDKLRILASDPDPQISLAAWRAIRSAARATSGLWTPHARDLADADAAIAGMSARQPGAASPAPTTAAREAWYRDRLARDARPGHGAAALAGVGVLLWIGGALALARSRKLQFAALMAVGLVVWAAGLYNA
jgi:hypothetical protein